MAHPDLNELVTTLLKMAQMLLEEQGAFLPIGAIMLPNGEIRHVGAQIEGEEYPGAQPLLELLTTTFQRQASEGKLRAAGIAYDVLTIPPGQQRKQDAICCSLEHYLGEAVDVFKPYIKTEEGQFEFGEIFANSRPQRLFSHLPRG